MEYSVLHRGSVDSQTNLGIFHFVESTRASAALICFLFLVTLDHLVAALNETAAFTFNGFSGANLSLDGMATITPDSLLMLTNGTTALKGHAFHPTPLRFHGANGRRPWRQRVSVA